MNDDNNYWNEEGVYEDAIAETQEQAEKWDEKTTRTWDLNKAYQATTQEKITRLIDACGPNAGVDFPSREEVRVRFIWDEEEEEIPEGRIAVIDKKLKEHGYIDCSQHP